MKIAVVSDDGNNISQHFGRAPYYVVVTVETGQITNRETRSKLAHGHGIGPEVHGNQGAGHGMGPVENDRHVQMAASISDCSAVICRGMGQGAYMSLSAQGIKPVITDIGEIDAAVLAYAGGTIVDHTERLH